MIYGTLRRLGYHAVGRGAYPSFAIYKDARNRADAEVLALLAEISQQEGRATEWPAQGEPPGGGAQELAALETWLDLKRLAAHLEEGRLPEGPRTDPDPTADPLLAPYLAHQKEPKRYPHLLGHAEASGFFVPLSFARPFWLSEQQRSVGSAPRLIEELRALEKALERRAFAAERELLARLAGLCQEACQKGLTLQLSTSAFCFE